ncbi:MAG TPA: HAD-IIIA family hydrolase [Gemmatimonadales bacterium]|nr:HAD-IIIA family hydrolase [Gemmatimonadales bacterium]
MADLELNGWDLIVFDADGTLRRTTVPGQPCPHTQGEWELLPGVAETLREIAGAARPPHLGVATNQDHVGYGLLEETVARQLVQDLFVAAIGRPLEAEAVVLCPHPREAGCGCHKPAPGMLHRLMAHFGACPEGTLFVGDAPTDREAAERARVTFAWAWDFFGWGWRGGGVA